MDITAWHGKDEDSKTIQNASHKSGAQFNLFLLANVTLPCTSSFLPAYATQSFLFIQNRMPTLNVDNQANLIFKVWIMNDYDFDILRMLCLPCSLLIDQNEM